MIRVRAYWQHACSFLAGIELCDLGGAWAVWLFIPPAMFELRIVYDREQWARECLPWMKFLRE